jgi:hypothetical protein
MEGQGDQDELYPIAVLIDELKVRREFDARLGSLLTPQSSMTMSSYV